MPTTPKGITYPDSAAHTRLWEHFQALADTADLAIPAAPPKMQTALQATALTITAGNYGDITVTFPVPFAKVPFVVFTSAFYGVVLTTFSGPSTTSVGVRQYNARTSGSVQNPSFYWLAIEL